MVREREWREGESRGERERVRVGRERWVRMGQEREDERVRSERVTERERVRLGREMVRDNGERERGLE